MYQAEQTRPTSQSHDKEWMHTVTNRTIDPQGKKRIEMIFYLHYHGYYMLLYNDNTEEEYLAYKIMFLLNTEPLTVCSFRFLTNVLVWCGNSGLDISYTWGKLVYIKGISDIRHCRCLAEISIIHFHWCMSLSLIVCKADIRLSSKHIITHIIIVKHGYIMD